MSILFTKTQQYLIKKNKKLTIDTSKTDYPTSSDSEDISSSQIIVDTQKTKLLLDLAFSKIPELER